VPVTKLNDVREDDKKYDNRVDTTLADVFSLLSLFFLTIGKTKELPATYSQLASMRVSRIIHSPSSLIVLPNNASHVLMISKQILNHMDESAVYSEADLAPFHRRLAELRTIITNDAKSGRHADALIKLLERQLHECGPGLHACNYKLIFNFLLQRPL
jgi:hypothetical protein